MLLWTWVCKYQFETMLSIFLDIYPKERYNQSLNHTVVLFLVFWETVITLFHSSSTILHSHQQKCTSWQYLVFWIAILIERLLKLLINFVIVQSLSSVSPMDCSTPGFSVHHCLPELAQTHVCWVRDAIQPSCPLSSPSPPAFDLFQRQGLF